MDTGELFLLTTKGTLNHCRFLSSKGLFLLMSDETPELNMALVQG